jgi:radical SAM protein with 4Fe4S-binding SPASM domain
MSFAVRHITFEATRRCNLGCLHCYNHWRVAGEPEPAAETYAQSRRTLRRLFDQTRCDHITFTGGEPLIADGFAELVLTSRLRAKNVTVISNGAAAEAGRYGQLADMGVSLFQFPLLAPEASLHDSCVCLDGAFERVCAVVRYLVAREVDVCAVLVLSALNASVFADTLRLARSLGVRRCLLARFNIGGRGLRHMQTLLPSLDELHRAFAVADRFSRDTGMSISANVCLPHCVIDPARFARCRVSSCAADPRLRPVTIDYAGDVRMCNHSPRVMGNIHEQGIEDMMQSPYARQWQDVRPVWCGSCERWSACRGGCRAAAEQMGYGLDHADPIIELTGAGSERASAR